MEMPVGKPNLLICLVGVLEGCKRGFLCLEFQIYFSERMNDRLLAFNVIAPVACVPMLGNPPEVSAPNPKTLARQ